MNFIVMSDWNTTSVKLSFIFLDETGLQRISIRATLVELDAIHRTFDFKLRKTIFKIFLWRHPSQTSVPNPLVVLMDVFYYSEYDYLIFTKLKVKIPS